jgi:hypothetical protein
MMVPLKFRFAEVRKERVLKTEMPEEMRKKNCGRCISLREGCFE